MADDDGIWECADCQQENTEEDLECCACEAPKPKGKFAGIKVGLVTQIETIPKMSKLRAAKVEVGNDDVITIVTNAQNVSAGSRVVVATIGATVVLDGEEVEVKKSNVGGRKSEGIICDAGMLGWKGGGKGVAVTLPDSFPVGAAPPESRPRKGA